MALETLVVSDTVADSAGPGLHTLRTLLYDQDGSPSDYIVFEEPVVIPPPAFLWGIPETLTTGQTYAVHFSNVGGLPDTVFLDSVLVFPAEGGSPLVIHDFGGAMRAVDPLTTGSFLSPQPLPHLPSGWYRFFVRTHPYTFEYGQWVYLSGWTDSLSIQTTRPAYFIGQSPVSFFTIQHQGPDLPAEIQIAYFRNAEGVAESTFVLDGWNHVDNPATRGVRWTASGWVLQDSATTWWQNGFSVDLSTLAKTGGVLPAPSRMARFRKRLNALRMKGGAPAPPTLTATYTRVLVAPQDTALFHLLIVGDTSRLITYDRNQDLVVAVLALPGAGSFEDLVLAGGFLFASQPDSSRVLKFSLTPLAVVDTLVFNRPTGLGEGTGDLLVTETGTGRIYRIDAATGTTIRSYGGFTAPTDVDRIGPYFVISDTASGGGLILVDTAGGTTVRTLATGTFLQVVAGPSGEVFAYRADSGRFFAWDTLGTPIPFDGGPAASSLPHWARGPDLLLVQADLDLSWGTYAVVDLFQVVGGLSGEVQYVLWNIGQDLLRWLAVHHSDSLPPGTSVAHRFRYTCTNFKQADRGTWYPLDSLTLLEPASDSGCFLPSTDLTVHVRLARPALTVSSPVCTPIRLVGLFRAAETVVWDTLFQDTLLSGDTLADTLIPPADSFPAGDYRVELVLRSTDSLGLEVARKEAFFRIDSSGVVVRLLPGSLPVWVGETLKVGMEVSNLADSTWDSLRVLASIQEDTLLDTLLDLVPASAETLHTTVVADRATLFRVRVLRDTLLLDQAFREINPNSVRIAADTLTVPDTVGPDSFRVRLAGEVFWVDAEGSPYTADREVPVAAVLAYQDTLIRETLRTASGLDRTWVLAPSRGTGDTLRLIVATPNDTVRLARYVVFSPGLAWLPADSVLRWTDTTGSIPLSLLVSGRPATGWLEAVVRISNGYEPLDTLRIHRDTLMLAPDTLVRTWDLSLPAGDYFVIRRAGVGRLELARDTFRLRVRRPLPLLLAWWVDTLAADSGVGVHVVLENPVPRGLLGELAVRTVWGEDARSFSLDSLARDTFLLWLPPAPHPGDTFVSLTLLQGGVPRFHDVRWTTFGIQPELVYPESLEATMGDVVPIPIELIGRGTAHVQDTLRLVWGEFQEVRSVSLWPGDTLRDTFFLHLPEAFASAVERPFFAFAGRTWMTTLRVEGLGVQAVLDVPPAARVGDTIPIRAVLENRSVVPFNGLLSFRFHTQETTLVLALSGQKVGFFDVDTLLLPDTLPAVWISPVFTDTLDSLRVDLFGDSLQHVSVHLRRVDTLTPWVPPESLSGLPAYQLRLRFSDTARVDRLVLHRYRNGQLRDTTLATFPRPADTVLWTFVMDTTGPTQDVYLEVNHESGRGVLWTSRKIQVARDSLAVWPDRPRYTVGDTLRLVVASLRPDSLVLDPGVLGPSTGATIPADTDTVTLGLLPPVISASYPVTYAGRFGDSGVVWVDVEGFKVGVMELRATQGPPERLRVWMRIRSEHAHPESLTVVLQVVQHDTQEVARDTLKTAFSPPEIFVEDTLRLSGARNGPALLRYTLAFRGVPLARGSRWLVLSGLDRSGPVVTGVRVWAEEDTARPVRIALKVEDESPVTGQVLVRRDSVWDTLQIQPTEDSLVVMVPGVGRTPTAWFARLVDAEGNLTRFPEAGYAYLRRPVPLNTAFVHTLPTKPGRVQILRWRHPGEEVEYARGRDERWMVVDTTRTMDVVVLPSRLPAILRNIRFYGVEGTVRVEVWAAGTLRTSTVRTLNQRWEDVPLNVAIPDTPVFLRFSGVPRGVLGFQPVDRKVVLTPGFSGTPLLSVHYAYPVPYEVRRERILPVSGAERIWRVDGTALADTLPGEGQYRYVLALRLDTLDLQDVRDVVAELEAPWVHYAGSALEPILYRKPGHSHLNAQASPATARRIARFRIWDASGVQDAVGWLLVRPGKVERIPVLRWQGDTALFQLPLRGERMWVEVEDGVGNRARRGPFYPVVEGLSGVLPDTVLSGWIFVTGDVTVPENTTVHLEDAVLVQAPEDQEKTGWDRHQIEWVVRGNLEGRNCTFLSAGLPPAWGIRLEGGTLALRDCRLEGGRFGIYGHGQARLEGNVFQNLEIGANIAGGVWVLRGNRFMHAGEGLRLEGLDPQDQVVLRQNRFQNIRVGIRVRSWPGRFVADLYRAPGESPAGLNGFVDVDTVLVNETPARLFFAGNFLGTIAPDSLDARVVDDEEGVGGKVVLLPTYTLGTLTRDTLLCHPLPLAGDLVIPEGVTVTICPHLHLYALAGMDLSRGGYDPHRVEVVIRGNWKMQPVRSKRPEHRVVLTSDAWKTAPATWGGVVVQSTEDVRFRDMEIAGASRALEIQSRGKRPVRGQIRNVTFRHNRVALDVRGTYRFEVSDVRVFQAETVLVAKGRGWFEGNHIRESKVFVVHTGPDTVWARWNDWGVVDGQEIARRMVVSQGVVIWDPWIKPGEAGGVQAGEEDIRPQIRVLPARGALRVVWTMPEATRLRVRVLDRLGRRVDVWEARVQGAGERRWTLPAGIYLVEVNTGGRPQKRKVIVVR